MTVAEIRCTMCGWVGDAGASHPYDLCSRIAELAGEAERDGWTREWRAVASGDRRLRRFVGRWTEDKVAAEWRAAELCRAGPKVYDDVWLERRTVSPLERVSEEDKG